ncbi:DUF998 domain-containing protein [Haloglomus litoreum]|uniref:DUF998 domain-containing protein n=1 Tax=Haloglomus litoreum TaxID=3034026 RepID=UPI0023E8FBE1|nr:DUF998 domain-containing protein [Haloglomus sp. DT116]
MTDSHTRLAGTASVVVLALAVLVGVALDPTVRLLPVRARLSDLGRPGGAGAFPFDYGLVVAGLLGLAFVRAWWPAASESRDRVAAGLAGVVFGCLAVAGLFPEPSAVHLPFLAGAYLAAWAGPLLDGVRLRRDGADDGGRSRAGVALLAGAALVALLWGIRAVVQVTTFLLSGATSALLLTEVATLALFAGWVLFRAWVGGPALTVDAPAGDLSVDGR